MDSRQKQVRIDSRAAGNFCAALADSLRLTDCAFTVTFISLAAMRRLNRDWRGKDYATDVLSFAYADEMDEGRRFLGEIMIAPEVAARQAKQYGVTTEQELRKLLVHGVLHLMGYDHETDKGEMNRMQSRVLRRRFFSAAPDLTAPDTNGPDTSRPDTNREDA